MSHFRWPTYCYHVSGECWSVHLGLRRTLFSVFCHVPIARQRNSNRWAKMTVTKTLFVSQIPAKLTVCFIFSGKTRMISFECLRSIEQISTFHLRCASQNKSDIRMCLCVCVWCSNLHSACVIDLNFTFFRYKICATDYTFQQQQQQQKTGHRPHLIQLNRQQTTKDEQTYERSRYFPNNFTARWVATAAPTFQTIYCFVFAHSKCNAIYLNVERIVRFVCLLVCLCVRSTIKDKTQILIRFSSVPFCENKPKTKIFLIRFVNQKYARATFNTVSQQLNSFSLQMNVFFAFKYTY